MGRLRRYNGDLDGNNYSARDGSRCLPQVSAENGARRDGGATVRVLGADNPLISLWYSSLASYHIRAGMCDP